MNTTPVRSPDNDTHEDGNWEIAGLFLDALTRRDFPALQACLDPALRFRALVPRGPLQLDGAEETTARFQQWFGDHEIFEIVDASIGNLGPRMYLRWRIRTGTTLDPDSFRVVEQHAFATAASRIESLDLLCSGFHSAR